MKFLRLILLSFFAPCLAACAAAVGDVQLGVKSEDGPLEPVWITKTANRAIGWNESGVLGPVSISGGNGSSAWADITGKPTTLAGYGIVDSITAALAASTYQPLITDGSLTIARTSGLQAALDAKLSSTLAASTYQPLITDGSLSIARTSGLQAALDAKLSSTLAASTYQTIITDGSLTIARTSGLQTALDAKLSSTLAASTYQPLSARLTEISGISNARGLLYNGGSGLEGYLNFSQGGQPATDGNKIVQFNLNGELSAARNFNFNVPAAGGGYDTSTLSAPATLSYAWELPAASGTLALTSSNISGTAAGLSATLAVTSGGTGQTTLQAALNSFMSASGALSQGDVFYFNGTNVVRLAAGTSGYFLKTNGAGANPSWAAGGSGGGTKTIAVHSAKDNQPPASNFATLDTRNSIAVLAFDDASTKSAVFVGVIPEAAVLTSGLIVSIRWMAATATTGNAYWSVAWEKSNTDLDSDSFDTATSSAATTNGTSGIVTVTNITCTSIDSLAALDLYRLRIQRLGADGSDTMSGEAQIFSVEIRTAN